MNELIHIDYTNPGRPAVSGRELHEFLEVKTAYKDWFPRMCEYGFSENLDFCSILSESTGGRRATDHALTIDMAKEICMLQRNEKGKQARQYFIQLEKAWNSPEQVMARALKLADEQLAVLRRVQQKVNRWQELTDEWEELTAQACNEYRQARKKYEKYRALRNDCRKGLQASQIELSKMVGNAGCLKK